MNIDEHAQGIALKICDNEWWDELSAIDEEAKFPGATERELFSKRLQYYVKKMEGDMSTEAPMYTFNLCKRVMQIFDNAQSKES